MSDSGSGGTSVASTLRQRIARRRRRRSLALAVALAAGLGLLGLAWAQSTPGSFSLNSPVSFPVDI